MKRVYPLIISMIMSIMLIGCSVPGLNKKEEEPEKTIEYLTGTLDSVREDTITQMTKDGEETTSYTVFVIVDDFGDLHEINFYDIENIQSIEDESAEDDVIDIEDTIEDSTNDYTGFVPISNLISGSTVTIGYYRDNEDTSDILIGVSYNVDYVPLELVTGVTSYELLSMTYDWHYQEIHSEITMEGTYKSGGRTMDYSLSDMVTKESDGNVFHSVETIATSIEGKEENRTLVVYADLVNNLAYYNVNYAEWNKVGPDVPIDTKMDISQSEESYTQTSYKQDGSEYIIDGVSSNIEAGYIGGLIKGILSEYAYDPNKLSYTMTSIIDTTNNQIILSEYVVNYDGVLFAGDDELELSKFEIMINFIEGNNTGSVTMPDYIQGSIDERARPKFLYEVFFNKRERELTDKFLKEELSDWCEVIGKENEISFLNSFKAIITHETVLTAEEALSAESSNDNNYDAALECVKKYYNDYMIKETGEAVFEVKDMSEFAPDEINDDESEDTTDEDAR